MHIPIFNNTYIHYTYICICNADKNCSNTNMAHYKRKLIKMYLFYLYVYK